MTAATIEIDHGTMGQLTQALTELGLPNTAKFIDRISSTAEIEVYETLNGEVMLYDSRGFPSHCTVDHNRRTGEGIADIGAALEQENDSWEVSWHPGKPTDGFDHEAFDRPVLIARANAGEGIILYPERAGPAAKSYFGFWDPDTTNDAERAG